MAELIKDVLEDLNKQLGRIERSLNLLNDEQIWKRPKDTMNSIGNLCLHLAGNEYQNISSAIGNRPFIRERSREFTSDGGLSNKELTALLRTTRAESEAVLADLTDDDLLREVIIHYDLEDWNRMYQVQASAGETCETRVIGRLLVQVAAHYGYHAGQIVLLTKLLTGTDEHLTGQYH
ncbi:DinB family protein [Paenibacillus pinistramenti]|uniref:DinB family protein n=1 Tax=Paenibacillus pinistramenti TaxID=1768003 RepID=UPI0011092413|nr:DinB family protein [Paenibacillus pinistramenti]